MSSKFEKLVKEVVKIDRELRHWQPAEAWKQSPKAFLRQAMENANTTHERLDRLQGELHRPVMQ